MDLYRLASWLTNIYRTKLQVGNLKKKLQVGMFIRCETRMLYRFHLK